MIFATRIHMSSQSIRKTVSSDYGRYLAITLVGRISFACTFDLSSPSTRRVTDMGLLKCLIALAMVSRGTVQES
jgi:hypothetical protein